MPKFSNLRLPRGFALTLLSVFVALLPANNGHLYVIVLTFRKLFIAEKSCIDGDALLGLRSDVHLLHKRVVKESVSRVTYRTAFPLYAEYERRTLADVCILLCDDYKFAISAVAL